MMHKTWNARDQTYEELRDVLEERYERIKEIKAHIKHLKEINDIETAKELAEEVVEIGLFANTIEMELMRREYTDGIP